MIELYKTKIRKLVCVAGSRADDLDGINIRKLTEEKKKGLVLFTETSPPIVVESGKGHELVHDDWRYIGVIISSNGEYPRQYKIPVRYVRLANNFVADYELVHG